MHERKVDAAFLENRPVLENASSPATATVSLPRVFTKVLPVQFFNAARNPILKIFEVGFSVFAPARRFDHTGWIIYNYAAELSAGMVNTIQ